MLWLIYHYFMTTEGRFGPETHPLEQWWKILHAGFSFFAVGILGLLWGVHILILRGIKEAAALNTIATFAKMVPILLFIVIVIIAFKGDVFALNFWGGEEPTFANVSSQVRNTMLVTVFVFVGIEGASVYSRYAKDRNDVGIATILGFLGVLALLVLVTMLSYGILLRPELRALATPSMAGVLEAIVGRLRPHRQHPLRLQTARQQGQTRDRHVAHRHVH